MSPYYSEVYFQSNNNEATILGGVQVSNSTTMITSMWGPQNANMGPDNMGTRLDLPNQLIKPHDVGCELELLRSKM